MSLCQTTDCGKQTDNDPAVCDRCLSKDRVKSIQEQELARRALARRRLLPFVQRMQTDYDAGWFQKDLCHKLEQFAQDVIDKKSPRLMIMAPPRHGKSRLASVMFPAWFLGNHPAMEIIMSSYSADLAMDMSKDVRTILREQSYKTVFKESKLDPDSQSVAKWKTTESGAFTAAGVGGPLTGRGAHVMIVDDPIKNFEDANSTTNREMAWNWWNTTAYTRLAPGAGCLLIMTRWHHDDLFGRLLEQEAEAKKLGIPTQKWDVVMYPAIATEDEKYRKSGEALHPERYPLDQLNMIKNAPGNERNWASLYQQTPTLDEGAYFKKEFFKYWQTSSDSESPDKVKPDNLNVYATWDLALGQKETNDYTASVVFGLDQNENIYVLDIVRERMDAMEIVEKIIDQYEQWKPIATGIERTHMQMALGPFLNKRIRERKVYSLYIHEQLPGRRDKELRARSIQGRIQQGKVFFPRHAPWLHTLTTEMLQFPAGTHDDLCDCLAYAGLLLEELSAPEKRIDKPVVSWKDKLNRYSSSFGGRKSAMTA